MGGYGTWALALHPPNHNRFASLMPICGGGDSLRASHIADIPQWIHHGELDDIIPIAQSDKMVKALKKAGASEDTVNFTRYPELAHDSWTEAYGRAEVWQWVLEKKLTERDS
jgi:predicted peptidase